MDGNPFVKSPAFQIYPADFLADQNTLVMTVSEIGAYCLLLFVCWRENGLPDDLEELAAIARTQVKQFETSWQKRIRRCFEKRDDGMWSHKRLEEERLKQAENRIKRQKAATKGAGARWQPDSKRIASASENGTGGMRSDALSSSDLSLQSSIAIAGDVESGQGSANRNRIDSNLHYPFDHFAVIEYQNTLKPEPGLAIQQAEVIAVAVDDSELSRAVWTSVLREWKGNAYQTRHAGKAVDKYVNEMAAIAEGKRQPPPGVAVAHGRMPTVRERMAQ